MTRDSVVGSVNINTVEYSSTLQVGDLDNIQCRSNVLAVQRQISDYFGNEGNLDAFPLFSRPIPEPVIREKVEMRVTHVVPVITVERMRIIGISASSVVQIGSNRYIECESRIKNIRQIRQVIPE